MSEKPKSSIHFEYFKDVQIGFFYHNSREKKTANSIFQTKDNYCNLTGKKATELFFKELEKRIEKYTQKTGKKLHKNAIKHISAIVNIKSTTTQKDIQELIKFLEDTLGTKVIQVAVHRDEGHYDPITGEKKVNYHAHLEIIGLDQEGRSIRRKLDKKMLIYIQTEVAKILGMERGINYNKERKPRPKRLSTYQYKKAMELKEKEKEKNILLENLIDFKEQELKQVKQEKQNLKFKNLKLELTVKQLKEEIEKLRKKMIEANKELQKKGQEKIFTQEDYKYLSTLKKATNSTNLEEVYLRLLDFNKKVNKKIKEKNEEIEKLKKENEEKDKIIEDLKNNLKNAQLQIKELKQAVEELEKIVKKQKEKLKLKEEEDYIYKNTYPKLKI